MPNLKVKPSGKTGRVTHVTPESAGWTYVGFDMYRLKPGETASGETGEREVCLVWVSGKGKASAGTRDFGTLGERMSPFDGAPHALYIPMESTWSVTAETDLELAVCSAPGGGTYEAKAIPPGTHPPMCAGTWQRRSAPCPRGRSTAAASATAHRSPSGGSRSRT